MKLGVNNEVNPGTKKAALKLMAGGPSKINLPNSHPSNPIHKAAQMQQKKRSLWHKRPKAQEEPTANETSQHEINKTAVIIGVVGLVALLFMSAR